MRRRIRNLERAVTGGTIDKQSCCCPAVVRESMKSIDMPMEVPPAPACPRCGHVPVQVIEILVPNREEAMRLQAIDRGERFVC